MPKNADIIENFGHKTFLGKFCESSYDCLALVPVSVFIFVIDDFERGGHLHYSKGGFYSGGLTFGGNFVLVIGGLCSEGHIFFVGVLHAGFYGIFHIVHTSLTDTFFKDQWCLLQRCNIALH